MVSRGNTLPMEKIEIKSHPSKPSKRLYMDSDKAPAGIRYYGNDEVDKIYKAQDRTIVVSLGTNM